MPNAKTVLALSLMLIFSLGRAQDSQVVNNETVAVRATKLQETTTRNGITGNYLGKPGQLQVPVSSLPISIGVPQYATEPASESDTERSLNILFKALAPVTPVDLSQVRNNIPRSLESLRDFKPPLPLQPK